MNDLIKSGPIQKTSESFFTPFITQVYGWMAAGLFVTAVVAFFLSKEIVTNIELARTISGLILPLFLIELVFVWLISARAGRDGVFASGFMFIIYSILNGIFFSVILAVNELDVAGLAFFATFLTFAVMSVYGVVTKQDLTKWGNLAFMGLIAGIIGSLVNLFVGSEPIYWIITYGLLIVFVVLVAYDTQKMKMIAAAAEAQNIPASRFAVAGALRLYLDFINLFLLILRIFGGGRD